MYSTSAGLGFFVCMVVSRATPANQKAGIKEGEK